MAAASASEAPAPQPAALSARGLSLARAGAGAPLLERLDLTLAPGECVLLEGATGSGKSTLLRALAGLGGVEPRAGSVERRARTALLLQHVETQLLCPGVAEEVGLGLPADLDVSARAGRVDAALGAVGLAGFEAREVDELSVGQRQRVVLAALLALEPGILLLDEPFAALDAAARRALVAIVDERKRRGTAFFVAEHAPRELLGVVDRRLRVEGGRLHAEPAPGPGPPAVETMEPVEAPPPARLDALAPGDRVLLTGPNGSGKSFHLRALARQQTPRGPVALVLQEPRRALFARTVRDEVAFGLARRAELPPGPREARVDGLLERFGLHALADRSPRRLSFGQQHRLAIAAALAPRPAVVLLDEPFAGLDAGAREALLRVLADEQAESGSSCLLASHDREPLDRWCARVTALPAREAA